MYGQCSKFWSLLGTLHKRAALCLTIRPPPPQKKKDQILEKRPYEYIYLSIYLSIEICIYIYTHMYSIGFKAMQKARFSGSCLMVHGNKGLVGLIMSKPFRV